MQYTILNLIPSIAWKTNNLEQNIRFFLIYIYIYTKPVCFKLNQHKSFKLATQKLRERPCLSFLFSKEEKKRQAGRGSARGQKTRGRVGDEGKSVSFPRREGIAGSRSVGQRAVDLQHGRLTSRHTVATLHQVDQSYFVETKEFARGARRHLDLVSSHAFSTIILHLPRLNPANTRIS